MKQLIPLALIGCLTLGTLGSLSAQSTQRPLWLRHQQISPDGRSIAFCYRGDIYTVPTEGGRALRLTSNAAYDGTPIWSPDSRQIAFSSDREGGRDVFLIGADGTQLRRITSNSAKEIPVAFLDANTLLFQADIMPTVQLSLHPTQGFVQTYAIKLDTQEARPKLWNPYPMMQPSLSGKQLLYTDHKGYEDQWRKHAHSPITRDIWLRDEQGKHTKLTSFDGEDRNAVWDGQGGFYYLSEREGNSNIYHRATASPTAADTRLTDFKKDPVRFLSRATDGTLCFGYDGEIYTLRPGSSPRRVPVQIVTDEEEPKVQYRQYSSGVSSFAVAPSGKEIAFVVHGEVYVTHTEYKTTKRITNTPVQERSVSFSPDGRQIVYAAERDGHWNIYMTELERKDDKLFVYARGLKERQLTHSQEACFQPTFSPDGKKVAFLRDRTGIYVYDLASGKETKVLDKSYNYSYADGDQHYQWSPDSQWILTNYGGEGGWMHIDCALVKADGSGERINLTESGYREGEGKFAFGGKAILFSSDRAGYRSHGSWGSEKDLYLMFLDREAYEHFRQTKEERELRKQQGEDKDKDKDKKTGAGVFDLEDEYYSPVSSGILRIGKKAKKSTQTAAKDGDKKKEEEQKKPFKPDFTDREDRIVRLTYASGSISDAVINGEGTKLYYIARYGTSTDLWERDLETQATRILSPGIGGGELILGQDGKTVYLGTQSGLKKLENGTLKNIEFAADFEHRPAEERSYIFDHSWQQVKEKFYDVKLHGVDWDYYRTTYRKFLPHINNDQDFAEMLSELLGELNASHTGARAFSRSQAQATASLGAFYDPDYEGRGLRILEVLDSGPLAHGERKVTSGMIIKSIDGEDILPGRALEPYFNGKVGKRVNLSILDPKTGKTFEHIVKPISQEQQSELLYRRWLRHCEELVRQRSGGRIAYVYVRAMNSSSFRSVFQDLLGKYRNAEAAIVDTRFNGGGWLHEDLTHLLSGKKYLSFTPRGQYIGDDPFMQWNKPSCVLMSEGNYSNGHGFPWAYKTLGLGKLIGAPVAGTMTAVWWESQINPHIVFGIPQVTCSDEQGRPLENQTLQPDILIYNTPEQSLSGYDAQLIRAVDEMMKTLPQK